MKRIEKSFILSLALIFVLSSLALGEAKQPISGPAKQEDVIQQIIQLAVENNSILQLQKSLIADIEQMPEPGASFGDLEELGAAGYAKTVKMEIPLLSVSQLNEIRNSRFQRKQSLTAARQTYENFKKSLISEALNRIIHISKLENQKRNSTELKFFLDEREISLRAQVKTGIEEPTALFDLTERIMRVSVEIQNATVELEILKLEMAINLGGEKWEEVLGLLNKLG